MRRLTLTLIAFLLAFSALLTLHLLVPRPLEAAPPPLRARVHPQVLKDVVTQGQATFIVYLREQADLAPIRARVGELGRLERRQQVVNALHSVAERTQPALLAFLKKAALRPHVQEVQRLWIVNALVVTGDRKALDLLAAHPDVARILPNQVHRLPDHIRRTPVPAIPWHLARIGADRVTTQLGLTGRGVVVANLDTGVDWTHPALQGAYRGAGGNHDYNWFDFTGTYPEAPDDGNGHGTFTMGLMVGASGDGTRVGVAPGARWIAVKVFSDAGETTDAVLHQAFQWILAPTDLRGARPDPAMAPDIVSNSWGSINGGDDTFLPDINAWRAAGIIPVFAAGNNGKAGLGSVDSPGSLPHVIAVGATDPNDLVADFSSRGPSPMEVFKPELSAPGVSVRSTLPGADYGEGDGTSFSTPIVAGVLALMLEANPTLDYEALVQMVTRTSDDLGDPGPDYAYGWGRVNAYAAVSTALNAGSLNGRVLDRAGVPIPGARVTGISVADPELTFHSLTDAQGHYRVAVPAGQYRLEVTAFGHRPATVENVVVPTGLAILRDVRLTPEEHFPLTVVVTSTVGPITQAVVSLVDTPVQQDGPADPEAGVYTLSAPAGTYTLEVRAPEFRIARHTVTLPAGTTPLTVTLRRSPRILLINGDRWAGDSVRFFYHRLLDRAGYPFAVWDVLDADTLPTLATLAPYDVVIWSHSVAAPGWYEEEFGINVWPDVRAYIDNGGHVLMSGPDIAYWEFYQGVGSDQGSTLDEYFGVSYVRDSSEADEVVGVPDDVLADTTLRLNAVLAYKNQDETDVLNSTNEGVIIQTYAVSPPNGAGIRRQAPGQRTVYLGYGLEGVDPGGGAEVLDRLITWLTAPEVQISGMPTTLTAGQVFTLTVSVHNPLQVPWQGARLVLDVPTVLELITAQAVDWVFDLAPGETKVFELGYRLAQPLPGGARVTVSARLEVPGTPPREAQAQALIVGPDLSPSTIEAPPAIEPGQPVEVVYRIANSGTLTATVAFTAFIPVEMSALPQRPDLAYDPTNRVLTWQGEINPGPPARSVYTYLTSDDPLGPEFAWVEPADGVQSLDMTDDRVLGPFPVGFSFPLFGETYEEFWVSSNGWLSFSAPDSSHPLNRELPTASVPLPLVAPFWDDLNPGRGGEVFWYSDGEQLLVTWREVPHFGSGGPYTFQVILYPDGSVRFQYLNMVSRLDSATIGVQGAGGAEALLVAYNEEFVHDGLALIILPPQPPQPAAEALPATVELTRPLPDNTPIHLEALARDVSGLESRMAATMVATPADFSESGLMVPAQVPAGQTVVLPLHVRNDGVGTGTAAVTVTLPAGLEPEVPPEMGWDEGARALSWRGTMAPSQALQLSVPVHVAEHLAMGSVLTVTFTLDDGAHPLLQRAYRTEVSRPVLRALWNLSTTAARAGDVLTSTLDLLNVGNFTATVHVTQTLPVGLLPVVDALPAAVTYLPDTHQIRWQGFLPPARENYQWQDDQSPGGPSFAWMEMPADSQVVIEQGDDVTVGPISLHFPILFYDQIFDSVYVNSNGWLSFTAADRRDFSNRQLPSADAPPDLLAVWWDDLVVREESAVRYWTDADHLAVVTWDGVTTLGGTAPYTFQVQLDASGVFTYQYKTMTGRLNSATIGLQQGAGVRGITVVYNEEPYMADGRVIRFLPPVQRVRLEYPLRVAPDVAISGPVSTTLTVAEAFTSPITLEQTVLINVANLSTSDLTVTPQTVRRGSAVMARLRLRNTGLYTATARPVLYVPPGLRVVGTNGTRTPDGVAWTLPVAPGSEVWAVAFLRLVENLPDGATLPLRVNDPAGWRAEEFITVVAPDFSPSTVAAAPARLRPGDVVTVTAEVINIGHAGAVVTWTLPLPAGLVPVADGMWAAAGTPPVYDAARGVVIWQGEVPERAVITLQVPITVVGYGEWTPRAYIATAHQTWEVIGLAVRWGWEYRLPWVIRGHSLPR